MCPAVQAVRWPGNRMRGGPVSRILSKGLPPLDGHSSGHAVARAPQAANPDVWGRSQAPGLPPRHPYSALLPVGLAVPLLLPVARWALTPPFHPYPSVRERARGRFHFCGAFRRIAPPGRYPAPWFQGVRTFLERLPARGHPALRANVSYACPGPGSSPDGCGHLGHDRAIAPVKRAGCAVTKAQPHGCKQQIIGDIWKAIA